MSNIISFVNVSKSYGEVEVLNKINLNIKEGSFTVIVGSSGSGKTTVLKMINGLIKPNSGNVFVKGKNLKNVDIIDTRRNIGYVLQGSKLFPHMSVSKNITYVPQLIREYRKSELDTIVNKMLGVVGLDESLKGRYPHELSGGQQQRVGIARALAAQPSILLMDEPFSAVDEITRRMLQEEIHKIYLETGITIIFVTHDITEALKLGTDIIIMSSKGIEQEASPKELIKNPKEGYVQSLLQDVLNLENSD